MPASSGWQLTIYGTNTDAATTGNDTTYGLPYVATPVGAASKSIYILKPQFDFEFDSQYLEDIGGTRIGYQNKRAKWNVESYPFAYNATALTLEQDLDDVVALADVLSDYQYLFMRIDAGSRAYPATGYVYPITLGSWSTQINAQYGTRIVNIELIHRKRG